MTVGGLVENQILGDRRFRRRGPLVAHFRGHEHGSRDRHNRADY